MSTSAKLALGIVTVVPFLYGVALFSCSLWIFISAFSGHIPGLLASTREQPPKAFLILFLGHLLMMGLMLALLLFYFAHLFRNPRIKDDRVLLWGLLLFVGNALAMPVYWYLYLWRDAPAAEPGVSSG